MELVSADQPKGNKALFVCPYHAWSYGTNGELMNVPFGEEGFANCDPVNVESRNLVELPAAERAGFLFVIPAPAAGQDTNRTLQEAITEEYEKELSAYGFGKHVMAASQTFRFGANWKMVNDTYGEAYHFATLHPTLAELVLPNTSLHRTFGPRGGCMSFPRFTTKIMADGGVEESRWEEPSIQHHFSNGYHIAPNVVMILGPNSILMNQMWPITAGESLVTVSMYVARPPDIGSLKEFKGLLDVVATEDFPSLPPMQRNFTSNAHAEVVFGRNEPCLAHEHRYFDAAVQGRYTPKRLET